MKKDKGFIRNSGMGGAFNPPTHPEHSKSVSNRTKNDFWMSLSSAINTEWLDDETKKKAKEILDSWVKPDINSEEIQDWIYQCFGYFGNGKRAIDHIKSFYPEYELKIEHIENAYWGKKQNN